LEEIEKIRFTFKYRADLIGSVNECKYGCYISIIAEDREKADVKAKDFEKHLNTALYFKGYYSNFSHILTEEEYNTLTDSQKELLNEYYKKKFNYVSKKEPSNKVNFVFYYKVVRNEHPEDEKVGNFIQIIEDDREKADIQAKIKENELNATLIYHGHDNVEVITQELYDTLTSSQKDLLHYIYKQDFNQNKLPNDEF
jgi:effector-binding domain-containing protein